MSSLPRRRVPIHSRFARSGDSRLQSIEESVTKMLVAEIEVGSFPSASWLVGTSKEILVEGAAGHSVLKPAKIPVEMDTIYDLASLTKPLITTTLVLQLAHEGVLELAARVSSHLPELAGTDKEDLTFVDLLTHRGGFQAWYPLYINGQRDEDYLQTLVRRPLRYRPGTREIYSCLGFVTLLLAVERITGRTVEGLASERIFRPLGLKTAMFNPPSPLKYRIAATEWGNANERKMLAARDMSFRFRDYMIWGEVDDGNAWYMGGMAGNAGLFGTARDVWAIAREYATGGGGILAPSMVGLALRNYTIGLEENRGLGWLMHMTRSTHPASVLSESCYGHTGFTGTSVWVDPDRDLIMVLLTNRLHPNVSPINMQIVRRDFHALVVDAWE